MEMKLLSVLVLFFGYVHFAAGEQKYLGDVLRTLGSGVIRTGALDLCTIEKPEDKCSSSSAPICSTKTCTFVPEYGEEITSIWQIYLEGYSSLFSYKKKKQYRKILDLGEKVTKSFEGEICENENTLCDCSAADPHDCNCDNTDVISVCKQKYTNKFSLYYVYNFFFCEPRVDPWALLFQKLIGSERRHLSYADTGSPPQYPQYNPHSQSPSYHSMFKYIQLLQKDKHHHLGELVMCEEKQGYSHQRPSPYQHNSHTPEYRKPVYMQNPKTIVKHAFLKVKVPSGCECEEY